jgi:hypothetical protein
MRYRVVQALPDRGYGYLPHNNRFTSEYLVAALPLGFQVRHCEDLRAGWSDPDEAPPPSGYCPNTRRTSGRSRIGARSPRKLGGKTTRS